MQGNIEYNAQNIKQSRLHNAYLNPKQTSRYATINTQYNHYYIQSGAIMTTNEYNNTRTKHNNIQSTKTATNEHELHNAPPPLNESQIPDILPPTSDYVFCNIFGTENCEYQLKCLLNAILDGDPYIQDLEIVPTEYKKYISDGKTIRLDIIAKANDNAIINVEMQCVPDENIAARMKYIEGTIIREHTIKEGDSYDVVPDTISIWIFNKRVNNRRNCKSIAYWTYEQNGSDPSEIMTKGEKRVTIELSKLEQTEEHTISNELSVWLNFLKHPTKLSQQEQKQKGVNEAMTRLSFLSHNMAERRDYMIRQQSLHLYNANMNRNYAKGKEEGIEIGEARGIEIGIEKGAKQNAIESAKKMLSDGMHIDVVAKYSGLTIDEIKCIAQGK